MKQIKHIKQKLYKYQYDSKGDVIYGMEYMYNPVNSRLFYGHGRTCLLFSYTNYFNSSIGDLN